MQRAISTNFLLNVGGTILPLLTAIITVPIYIAHIGAARYGVLAVVWILLGYAGFLDFGLTRASANALSKLGNAGPSKRTPVLVTSLYLNLFLGCTGGIIVYGAAEFLLTRYSGLTPELARELRSATPWVACMLPVALVSNVGAGAMESRERFLAANLFQTFGGVIGQGAPILAALLISPSLSVVLPAALIARSVSTGLIWSYVLWMERPVDIRLFDRSKVRELIGYGAWVSVTSVIGPMMETFDQLMIGWLLGPASLAHYTVPMNLATRSQILALALAKTLFPRLSQLNAQEATRLANRAFVTLAYGFGAVCGPAIVVAGPFLRLWVGEDFAAHAAPIARILLVGAWASGLAYIPYTLLQGQGRPDLTATVHAAEVLPFFLGLYIMMTKFGLPGAALVWTARTAIDCLVLLRVGRCWGTHLIRTFPAVALVAACWVGACLAPPSLALSAGLAAAMGATIVVSGFLADPASRDVAMRLMRLGERRWTALMHGPGSAGTSPPPY